MSTPAVIAVAVAVGMLLVGAVLGWLWRGAICRRRHAHLTASYEPAHLETLLHEPDAGLQEPVPAEDDAPPEPAAEPVVVPEPGPTSREAAPLPDGSAPDPAYVVKGKRSSRIYHRPGSPAYARTRADVWFRSVEDAEAAGFRAPKQRGDQAPPG